MPTQDAVPPLAKHLASSDKEVRDKATKKLATFFHSRGDEAISQLDMDKLWKGIFYCFWMSDKPRVQQALADELSDLIISIESADASLDYLNGFWRACVREWSLLDRLRMDKFYMLVRRFVNRTFKLLTSNAYESRLCTKYNEILANKGGPLCPTDRKVPTGLVYHLASIYLAELDKSLVEAATVTVPITILIQPWLNVIAATPNVNTHKHITDELLEPLLLVLSKSGDIEGYGNLTRSCEDDGLKRTLKLTFDVAQEPTTSEANRRKLYKLYKSRIDEIES